MDKNDTSLILDKRQDVKKYTISLKKCITTALKFGSDTVDGVEGFLSSVIDYENDKVYPCLTVDHAVNPWKAVYAPMKFVIADGRIPMDIVFKMGDIANGKMPNDRFGVTQGNKLNLLKYRKTPDIIHELKMDKRDDKWFLSIKGSDKEPSYDNSVYPTRYCDKDVYPSMVPLIKEFEESHLPGNKPRNLIVNPDILESFIVLMVTQSQTTIPYYEKDGEEYELHTFYVNFPITPRELEFHRFTEVEEDTLITSVLVRENIGTHNIYMFYKYIDIWSNLRKDFQKSVVDEKEKSNGESNN